jgi:hypothetical protein
MMDEVKYIAWLMQGLLPEIKYKVIPEGKSRIGSHADIIYGGLEIRYGEEDKDELLRRINEIP